MKLTPTPLTERVEALDYLRGIALLGILIANMLHFHSPYAYMDPYSWFTVPHEQSMFHFIDVFIEASFYPLFAMLFGYGVNMQYEKSLRNGTQFAPFMARRMGILLVFGVLHAVLIWSGDILFTYALMGFIMIAVIRIPKKWLLALSLVIYFVPTLLLYGILALTRSKTTSNMLDGFVDTRQIELAISSYGNGTFSEIFAFRLNEFFVFEIVGSITAVFIILPLIMFGAVLSKFKIIERMYALKGKLLVAMLVFIPIGVVLKNIPSWDGSKFENILLVQSIFGGPILTLGYGALFLLLFQIPFLKSITQPFANVGRMAFTTYIMQSVIATMVFYSYGVGLYGKVDIVTGTWLAIGIFAIQLIVAQVWLTKFRMGPLEAVWRKWSYGKNFVVKEEKK
ncbi:hypothetical protein CSV80_12595 [Sporosarcina sp. P12(2017)]|uniref:DUF418 domain-containing protein n=1 Tax=unclassified Sporosarcina TaxID=2647733 RepID=UPI000C16BAF9|nr:MULTISPECIES: DUF418 domain-containing protein [unclassified Sporosarcina]PIC56183.1 hypothetical protein CSV81_15725 [Sporosarcina sp. P10]PIC60073.1 hypothetical protein CSV80_12595 [Sporosarcina sp. P12(2017)]